jgi:hypothetical protein
MISDISTPKVASETVDFSMGIKIVKISDEFDIASDQLKQSRIDICNSCENKIDHGCTLCSCLLVIRTAYVDSFCPVGKW